MRGGKYLHLIRGNLFEKAKELARNPKFRTLVGGLAGGVINRITGKPDQFPIPSLIAQENNIAEDNWGPYGSFIGHTVTDILTSKLQPNVATPPTEGSIVEYAPLTPDSRQLKSVTLKNPPVIYEQDPVTGEERKIMAKISAKKRSHKKKSSSSSHRSSKKRSHKKESINDMIVPKKKIKKRRVYKAEIAK